MNDFRCKVTVDASDNVGLISIGQQHKVFWLNTVADGKQLVYALGFFDGATLEQLHTIPSALDAYDSKIYEFGNLTITIQLVG